MTKEQQTIAKLKQDNKNLKENFSRVLNLSEFQKYEIIKLSSANSDLSSSINRLVNVNADLSLSIKQLTNND
jgi:hypothetical protein